ncbi:MAG TPA: winged helix DNA-binding domain-containing protein [Anaerolineales bacterium]|nr:winged helix DNA-binding domain-containing protein [Anaerolineales bacterium]
MTLDIPRYRLHHQFLSTTNLTEPSQVVSRLGAIQAQDYAGAKWALALRLKSDKTDADLDTAFNEGSILRTHILRPTWHFVAPEDIRWMLELTAGRVHAANAFMYRQLGLDRDTLRKSYKVLEKALRGGKQLSRPELGTALQKAGIVAEGQRLGYFMMSAELDGIICSGGRRGKQFTYALLEERAPNARTLPPEEALAELTRRYFATRAPATLQDFAWWSGLTLKSAKQGIEMARSQFVSEVVEGKTYWLDRSTSPVKIESPSAHLLPNYDEYFIGFRDRSAIGKLVSPLHPQKNSVALNAHIVTLDGQIVGGWRRTLKKDAVVIEWKPITGLSRAQVQAIVAAANRYGKFMDLAVETSEWSLNDDSSL